MLIVWKGMASSLHPMSFYDLTKPNYETDREDDQANSIRMVRELALPALICPGRGPWIGSRRLYLRVKDQELVQKLSSKPRVPLPEQEWHALAQEVHQHLNLPEDFELRPGDVLGEPRAELLAMPLNDFLHPFPGQIIMTRKVLDALQDAQLTGFRAERVHVTLKTKRHQVNHALPELYELVVTGRAWRVGMDLDALRHPECPGRFLFPKPAYLVVDRQRWDGADFFNVDLNPNIVLVTQRVRRIIEEHRFTNVRCIPIQEDA
jgi:hypothetical protein